MLPVCQLPIPELDEKIKECGRLWASSNQRPRVTPDIKAHRSELVRDWADSDIPLVIRKPGPIGPHTHITGRQFYLCDNSPAIWAFEQAHSNQRPSLGDVRELLDPHNLRFPMRFVIKAIDRQKLSGCQLVHVDGLNDSGWKLCHMDKIGLKIGGRPEDLEFEVLLDHFKRLMKPSNHFVVPKKWAGLGELPQLIEEIETAEDRWAWERGKVDPAEEHFELSYGNADESDWDAWPTVARVGRPVKRHFAVEFLLDRGRSDFAELIHKTVRELDFYLVDKAEPDPWVYAKHHCGTSANLYSQVHWSLVCGDPECLKCHPEKGLRKTPSFHSTSA